MIDFLVSTPTWACLLAILVAIGVVAVAGHAGAHTVGEQRLRRTLAALCKSACPGCQRTFGSSIVSAAQTDDHMWDPYVGEIETPGKTLRFVCPHCARELQYRLDGTFFPWPPDDWKDQSGQSEDACPAGV